MSPNLAQCVVLLWFRLILYDLHLIFNGSLSTLLQPVLASSYPLWQDFSKRASIPIVCGDWFYEKAVWGVVKSWEFERNLRCSKILRIRRKNPMKWVLSISRDYWVYLEITLQSFKIWEFWGEFSEKIETFYQNKFSPATGVTARSMEDETQNAEFIGNRNPEWWGEFSPEACFGIFVRVILGWLSNRSLYQTFPVNPSLLYQAVGTQVNVA